MGLPTDFHSEPKRQKKTAPSGPVSRVGMERMGWARVAAGRWEGRGEGGPSCGARGGGVGERPDGGTSPTDEERPA